MLTDGQLAELARQIAGLLPGYLLLRDPPSVPLGAPEATAGDRIEAAGVSISSPD